MMTMDPTPELALHFLRLGAYGYLRKPCEPTDLIDLCARALRERALLRVEELLEERTRALHTSEAQYRLLVTERERAIVALRTAKEYAENIINSSLDIIVSVDAERHIIAFNTAAQRAFGYEIDEVLGQPVHMLYDDPAVGTDIHHNVLTDGHYTGEITNRRKDGTTFESYLSASVLRDSQGQMLGVMGISRDITERKQAEAALQASKEAAEAANRSKSAFLANISHEIRTPMNGILGMAELALETELNGEQREYLELVKVSAEALLGVINDLLDFSKIEAGKLVLDPREFSLRTSVHEAVKALAVPAYCKGLELICEVQPDVPDSLIGDVGRLRQIMVNLVGNAIKFTAEGEVVLRIALCPGTDAPSLTPGHDPVNTCMLHLSVADTGIGIPASQQRAIFQPFVQADGSMTRRYGGTGLGLSIAAQLAVLMDGSIWVDSTVGVGSTFHVTVRLGMQPEQSPGLPVLATLRGLKVLVVDDNTTQRHVLQGLLDSWFMCPTLVESGPAAIAALRHASQTAQPFAVVILDAYLADEASLAVALWRRRQPAPAAPLIVLTAATQGGDRQRWQEMYGAICVTKPVAPIELWEAMHQVLVCAPPITPASAPRPSLEPPARRPLRVLLAEDNTVNQRLAMRLLEKCGHTVTVVQDGTEALAALRRQTFDVVLMDVQMPHMDGLETTQAIRAREQDTAMHVPIVAMTAYAMQGDRERCLAAGMDGYVTKPLRPVELFETITRLTAPAAPMPETPPVVESDILDRKTLWERVAGDADLLREIVALFLSDCPERLLELHAALRHQDCPALAGAAHRLKGALGNISANNATEAVQRVEVLARAGDVHAVPEALARLEDELARLTPLLVVYAGDGSGF
jgi:PAS domain S-box-containing protein